MDTLTHALSGALLARATEPSSARPDQLPRRLRMWIGFWAAAFPDADFIINFIDPFTYLTTHRGVTHSMLLLPVWAIGLAFLFALIVRRRYAWRAFAATCALGIGAHIAGDVITSFGTMILAPFSNWRAELSTTFIIDPYFSAILVVGLLASAGLKHTRTPAVVALVILSAYVGAQAVLHRRAVAIGETYIAAQRLEAARAYAIPQPFSPFHWMVLVEQPKNYHLSYVSLWRSHAPPTPAADAHWLAHVIASYRPAQDAHWRSIPRYGSEADTALAEAAWNADTLARYRHFTLFPALYRIDRAPGRTCVWFNDLRFALVGRSMPFRYGACQGDAHSSWKIYRLANGEDGRDVLEFIPD